jgi:hypothetical protein
VSRVEDGLNDLIGSLPWEEVVRRQRLPWQSSTLFGENDVIHLHPLREVLKDTTAMADVDVAEIGEGHTNDFLHDVQALHAKARAPAMASHLLFFLFHLVHPQPAPSNSGKLLRFLYSVDSNESFYS